MSAIKTDKPVKENTQGRHYTPKSALRETQVPDLTTSPSPKIALSDPQLRKLG
jgi:hypothetical protein